MKFTLKRTAFLFLFMITSTHLLNAQGRPYFRVGTNLTAFRGEKTYLQMGTTLCAGYQWKKSRIAKWFKASGLALEFVYTNKKATLKNKTIGGGLGYDDYVSYNDIYCSVFLYEIPVLLVYDFPLNKKLRVQLNFGPAMSLALVDKSRIVRRRNEPLPLNKRTNYPFDYVVNPGDPSIFTSGGYLLNFGFGLSSTHFSLNIRFSPALSYEFVTIRAVDFHEIPDTVHFLFTLKLDPG